jgi:hypothetical protein
LVTLESHQFRMSSQFSRMVFATVFILLTFECIIQLQSLLRASSASSLVAFW